MLVLDVDRLAGARANGLTAYAPEEIIAADADFRAARAEWESALADAARALDPKRETVGILAGMVVDEWLTGDERALALVIAKEEERTQEQPANQTYARESYPIKTWAKTAAGFRAGARRLRAATQKGEHERKGADTMPAMQIDHGQCVECDAQLHGTYCRACGARRPVLVGAVMVPLDNGELDYGMEDEPDELWFDFIMNRPDESGRVVNWAQA